MNAVTSLLMNTINNQMGRDLRALLCHAHGRDLRDRALLRRPWRQLKARRHPRHHQLWRKRSAETLRLARLKREGIQLMRCVGLADRRILLLFAARSLMWIGGSSPASPEAML